MQIKTIYGFTKVVPVIDTCRTNAAVVVGLNSSINRRMDPSVVSMGVVMKYEFY